MFKVILFVFLCHLISPLLGQRTVKWQQGECDGTCSYSNEHILERLEQLELQVEHLQGKVADLEMVEQTQVGNLTGCSGGCPMGWTYWNGSCYILITDSLAWNLAAARCLTRSGHRATLVTITSQQENIFINTLFPPGDPDEDDFEHQAWIGINDKLTEGQWQWLGGDPVTYTDWLYGEPNGESDQNCGHLDVGHWRSDPCQWGFLSICEMSAQC